jgi:hypothetical protein
MVAEPIMKLHTIYRTQRFINFFTFRSISATVLFCSVFWFLSFTLLQLFHFYLALSLFFFFMFLYCISYFLLSSFYSLSILLAFYLSAFLTFIPSVFLNNRFIHQSSLHSILTDCPMARYLWTMKWQECERNYTYFNYCRTEINLNYI